MNSQAGSHPAHPRLEIRCGAGKAAFSHLRDRGFSLIEVVIAVGIMAFAIIAIIGMFPIGYKNAMESRRETRAAYIAEQIMSDLRASPYTNAVVALKAGDSLAESSSINLSQQTSRVFACDGENNVATEMAEADYTSGVAQDGVEYLVRITVEPNTGFTDLSRLNIEVSSPAGAPLENRSRYGFHTLIGERR